MVIYVTAVAVPSFGILFLAIYIFLSLVLWNVDGDRSYSFGQLVSNAADASSSIVTGG